MPTETILVVSAIVSAFIVFGVALAWASYQTGHLIRQAQQRSVENRGSQDSLGVIGVESTSIPANSNRRSPELLH